MSEIHWGFSREIKMRWCKGIRKFANGKITTARYARYFGVLASHSQKHGVHEVNLGSAFWLTLKFKPPMQMLLVRLDDRSQTYATD
jgi:hypothetical protein